MDKFTEEIFQVIERCQRTQGSRAASAVVGKECQMIVGNNPDRNLTRSKAASVQIVNKVKVIADFLNAKRY